MMYRISILLVTIICAIIALSIGLPADLTIFPFLRKSYVFANIIVVSMLYFVFFESFFLYRKLNSQKSNSDGKPTDSKLILLLHNVLESVYYICLLLPFIALCKVFLAYEFTEILSPFVVFAYFLVLFRMMILLLTMTKSSFERFMRIMIILTFLLPLLGFCLWEFSGISVIWLAYFSPAWFQMVILRTPSLVIYPYFILWLLPTLVLFSIIIFRGIRQNKQGSQQQ